MIRINNIYQGNVIDVLKKFPDNFIDCCITSPPYFGLRDYGTAKWEGGDKKCDHFHFLEGHGEKSLLQTGSQGTQQYYYKDICKKCGAVRKDDQIGLEKTPELYVQKLTTIFNEVKRILKKEGTLWLNLGDSYNGSGQDSGKKEGGISQQIGNRLVGKTSPTKGIKIKGIKPKDLIGIPWMVAFALRDNGWYLRQDIIWSKPNPMPEPVADRCTKSHEYIFLLSKSRSYYYDSESIKEKASQNRWGGHISPDFNNSKGDYNGLNHDRDMMPNIRNKRDVWVVNTESYSEAHFATFPVKLIIPMIKAGCPKNGIVLDPFMGSGTVGFVARQYNRNYIGIELNYDYIKLAKKRIDSLGLFK